MKTKSILISAVILFFAGVLWWYMQPTPEVVINQPINNETPLIVVDAPIVNSVITSPVTITGKARGYWFFEASFPIELKDGNGNTIGQGIAQAQGEWMTEDYVPFMSVINFTPPATPTGELILKEDNPSGLPENDDQIIVPVNF